MGLVVVGLVVGLSLGAAVLGSSISVLPFGASATGLLVVHSTTTLSVGMGVGGGDGGFAGRGVGGGDGAGVSWMVKYNMNQDSRTSWLGLKNWFPPDQP